MTPDDIKAYFSLSERFRHNGMKRNVSVMWGVAWLDDEDIFVGDSTFERLAIASMLVGLIQMRDVKIWHATHGGDAYVVVLNRIEVSRMSTLFNALLAACQVIDAAEKENNHE